jgi:hypothetical protein
MPPLLLPALLQPPVSTLLKLSPPLLLRLVPE